MHSPAHVGLHLENGGRSQPPPRPIKNAMVSRVRRMP
jgi:hypothetical protein